MTEVQLPPFDMDYALDDEYRDELFRETTKLIGTLFIARRDVKAVENRGWQPKRSKFTLQDFEEHLFGKTCLGTYLLDTDNNVKFMAFDIDLQKYCPYYKMVSGCDGEVVLEIEPDIGDLEGALHDSGRPEFPWARVILLSTITQVSDAVEKVLGLKTLNVVTGGGAHVLVPFGCLMTAKEARGLAAAVLESMNHWEQKNENFWIPERIHPDIPGHNPRWTHYSREIEVFPKQNEIKNEDGLGNLLRLPFGIHEKTGVRTFALSDCDYDPGSMDLHQEFALDALRGIAQSLGVTV